MPAEIKSGKVKIEFALSPSLKKSIQRQAKAEKKSVSQWGRDHFQALFKKRKK